MDGREPEFIQIYKDVAEIEQREKNNINIPKSQSIDIGNMEKIAQTITDLKDGLSQLQNKWQNRNSYLLLAAEVTGFWADCAHADIWLKSIESENSENDAEIDAKKALSDLEQFESNIVTPWNKKFELLKTLTKYEEAESLKIDSQEKIIVESRVEEVQQEPTHTSPVKEIDESSQDEGDQISEASKISTPPEIIDYSTSTQDFSSSQPTNSNSQQFNNNYSNQATMPSTQMNQQVPVLNKNASVTSSGKREAPRAPAANVPVKPDGRGDRNVSSQSSELSQHGSEITRKIERDNRGKKSGNRSWNQLYCVLSHQQLLFFKDQTTAAKAASVGGGQYSGRMTYKSESPLDLEGCQCQIAKDYTKRANVFRLKLSNGAEFLIQAASSHDLNTWVEKLNQHSIATPRNNNNNQNMSITSDAASNYSQSYNEASESRSKNSKGGFFRGSSSRK